MRSDVGTYLTLVRAGFARQANYRAAMFAGLATNIVFGFVRASILIAAVHSAGTAIGGYTAATISSYVWLSQGLIGAIELSGRAEIGDRVRTGDVAIDFTRPVDVQTWHLAEDLGRSLYTLIPRGLPSVLVGALTFGLVMPATPLPYVMGVLSIVMGVTISFYGRYAINILGFWLLDTRGVRTAYLVTSTFLAGLYVPVSLFPDWLHTLAYCTPFPSILQTPINVISGQDTGSAAAADLLMQVGWVAFTCLVGQLLTGAGRRKLVIQGG
jgi:ABC-2 type transport system permease protein